MALQTEPSSFGSNTSFSDAFPTRGVVPEAGVEPAQPQWPRDFKSLVSTYFTTRAQRGILHGTKQLSCTGNFRSQMESVICLH